MRRALVGFVSAAAVLLIGGSTLAASSPSSQEDLNKKEARGRQGVESVTDAAGNPIDMGGEAAPERPVTRVVTGGPKVPEVRRGQEWWPYQTPLAPDASARRKVEGMSEDEILVNGVALLDIRNPQAALQRIPKDLVLDAGSQRRADAGYYLVKLKGFSRTQAQIDELQASGALLGEYLNVNTYIAKIRSTDLDAVEGLPFVAHVGDYQPAYKISPRIGLERIPQDEAYDAVTGQEKPWALEVVLHRGADVNEVLHELAGLGIFPQSEDVLVSGGLTVVLARTAPQFIPLLAKVPGIKWMAEKTYPRLFASSTSPTVNPVLLQNNGAFTTITSLGWKLWNAGIDGDASGTPQIVTVMDSGLNTSMEHFSENTASVGTIGPAHRKVVGYDVYGGDQCVTAYNNLSSDGGHGTWTSQHAVGSISNMSSNPDTTHTPTNYYDDGIAPAGKLYFQDIGLPGGLNPPFDLGPSIVAAIGKGSYVQNHSWGSPTPTYSARASSLDAALASHPDMIVTVAAGNDGIGGPGTIGDICTGKNVICVGGVDPASPNALFEDCGWDGDPTLCTVGGDLGSSRGPVAVSGRKKPDILAYMSNINLVGGESEAGDRPHAMCQTDPSKTVYWDWTNNSFSGGTSFAAPEVAGLGALVRDYFLAGYYPSGTATPADTLTPTGSLVKALLLASGEDTGNTSWPTVDFVDERYSSDVGYGRANLPAVLHIGNGAPFLWVQNGDTLTESLTKSFYFNITGNGVPLRVMLAYYDGVGDALVDDIDLKVTIGPNVYYGNYLIDGWGAIGGFADHSNTTEGVFLDAAHGLPATGTVRVDVIGFNNPGGVDYSLVVVGDVASQDVPQVSLDKGTYRCNETIGVTVSDSSLSSPVSVTLTSRDSLSTIIDTQIVSCTGGSGVFHGSIVAGSGIAVVDGGSVTATVGALTPSVASVSCKLAAVEAGFLIAGGCDNNAAGTNDVDGPLSNGASNEFYAKYMDAGEYTAYTYGFRNTTGFPLTDTWVSLSFSGAGASNMTVLNNPVYVGSVPKDAVTGAVFQVVTDGATAPFTAVNMDLDITSPAQGFTAPRRLTQVQLLQTNDTVLRLSSCSPFTTSPFTPWIESVLSEPGAATNPWRSTLLATTPGTVGAEVRTDTACGTNNANASVMVGNSATTAGNNFSNQAFSFLLLKFQPALRGNAGNGQPYRFTWKWHSFFSATEAGGNQTGVWGTWYNHAWNNAANPTADDAFDFPLVYCCFYHTALDYPVSPLGTWNWETLNTGTPDNPNLTSSTVPVKAPNQKFINFGPTVSGFATNGTYFAYGHEHADAYWYTGSATTAATRRDVAIDNDRLVYDEYYASAQAGASCSGAQVGLVAFDHYAYNNCPSSTAVISVVDANATSPLSATVTSPGTGDTETVVLTGTAPYFSGTIPMSTVSGGGNNNGTLIVLVSETLAVSYSDASPVGVSTASAYFDCAASDVVYVSSTQVSDNGDNDGIADNNETVTMDITIRNDSDTPLKNAKVQIYSLSPNIDCVSDPQALYGDVAAMSTATNPASDRFQFHVSAPVACTDWQNPPRAQFIVLITGDGVYGSTVQQSYTLSLDRDNQVGGAYTYTQNFSSDPGWTTGATPDDDGSCAPPWVNNFHWCASCGNAGAGYGAWIGNGAFGTGNQNYSDYDSSTLYSPVFTANGNVTMQFSIAYRTETTWDGAIAQYKVGNGFWTTLAYTTPAQGATTANTCQPLPSGTAGWTGTATGTSWTTTNAPSVAAANGQSVQFRWRLGTDSTVTGATYGGLGVDNVTITNLLQTQVCEPTRNPGLPPCVPTCATLPNGTACDDGDPCTQTDACSAGTCVGSNPVPAPGDTGNTVAVNKSGTDANVSWTLASDATTSDMLRGALSALPVGPGGGEEICFSPIAGTAATDPAVPAVGTGYWYLVRGHNACAGGGTYGTQGVNGAPGAPRVSTTCP